MVEFDDFFYFCGFDMEIWRGEVVEYVFVYVEFFNVWKIWDGGILYVFCFFYVFDFFIFDVFVVYFCWLYVLVLKFFRMLIFKLRLIM